LKAPNFRALVFKRVQKNLIILPALSTSKVGGWANKFFCLASYGILKQEVKKLHKRLIENVLNLASNFRHWKLEAKQGHLVPSLLWSPWAWSLGIPWKAKQKKLPQPFMELSSELLEWSMKGWTQIFLPQHLLELSSSKLGSYRICRVKIFCAWPPTPSSKVPRHARCKFFLCSNFQCQKLEAEHFFCVQPFLELSSSKLGTSKRGRSNYFYIWPPTFGVKNWRPNRKNLFRPFLKLSSLELKSFKRHQSKFCCLGQFLNNPQNLQNFKIL
jgi:hypothetical protein